MKKNQGFIKWIIIIVIALIILGYYGFDVKKAIEAPASQTNLTYAQHTVSYVWHSYLEAPFNAVASTTKAAIYPYLLAHCSPQLICILIGK